MAKQKLSQEEIVLAAARNVASIMQPKSEDDNEEKFIQLFAKKASDIFKQSGR